MFRAPMASWTNKNGWFLVNYDVILFNECTNAPMETTLGKAGIKNIVFPIQKKSPALFAQPQPSLQSLSVRPQACLLAGMVEQAGGYNFSIKRKHTHKKSSSLSKQVHNSLQFSLKTCHGFQE